MSVRKQRNVLPGGSSGSTWRRWRCRTAPSSNSKSSASRWCGGRRDQFAQRSLPLRHYRHAIGDWLWELPAGTLDSTAEDPLAAARRELKEETGLTAMRWESLGDSVSSPGVFTEVVHLFLASQLAQQPASPERGEVFEIAWVPLQEAVSNALEGSISDGKTGVGLCRAQQRLLPGSRSAATRFSPGLIK